MNLVAWSLAGLLVLFFLSHYTGYILNIRNDQLFAPFHFAGGVLVALLFYGLTRSYAMSILATLIIGIAWEIYEVMLWKLVLKKRKYKPKKDDTRNDLVLDFVGSLAAVALLAKGFIR